MGMVGRLFLLFLGLLVAASVLSYGRASQFGGRESPRSSPSQEKAHVYLPLVAKSYTDVIPPFGVQTAGLEDTAALKLVQEMGARWVRVGLSWANLEPTNTSPENFNWALYDAGFAGAAEKGLLPLVTISDNPSWAAETSCGPISPTYLGEFASFLRAMVSRYSRAPYNVHYWELYNEPDNVDVGRSWLGGCWGGRGKEYGEMLKVAYPAIKEADPQAQVVLGSLAHDWFTSEGGPFDERFLDDVLDAGKGNAAAYFDLLGFHYYPAFRLRWEPYGTDVMGKANYLRHRASSYGVDKPLITTEINMWSGSKYGGSEELQSDYVAQAYARGMAANLGVLVWFTLTDYNDWEYGLLRPDLTPKPVYTAYRVMANLLGGAMYKGPLQRADSLPEEVEGYVFSRPDGKELYVLWSTQGDSTAIAFAGSRITVTDKYGMTSQLVDGDDANLDGRVTISLTKSPIYVDIVQR